jgi:hypothetical protein
MCVREKKRKRIDLPVPLLLPLSMNRRGKRKNTKTGHVTAQCQGQINGLLSKTHEYIYLLNKTEIVA